MTDPTGSIVLRRSLFGRLLGGAKLQPLLTLLTVALAVRLIAQAVGATSDPQPPIGVLAAVDLLFAGVTALGATGYARADLDGITWRYYVRHHVRWEDVRQVTLKVTSGGVNSIWHTVDVRTAHLRLRVTPVRSAGPDRVRFARQLLTLAEARGCETRDEWR